MAEPEMKKAKSEDLSYSERRAVAVGNVKALHALKEEAPRGGFTRADYRLIIENYNLFVKMYC